MATDSISRQNPIISTGLHAGELGENLSIARADRLFTPLLHEAGILPAELSGVPLIPAVTYGVNGIRPARDVIELLPGTSNLVGDNIGTPGFNPHLSIRTRAHALLEGQMGKGKNRVRGTTYGHPAYVLNGRSGRYLFVGGDDSDLDILDGPHSERLANAYELGHVVLGGNVVVGDGRGINLGRVSLPSLIREIGQNIADFEVSTPTKVKILKDVKAKHEEGKSPDYRPYVSKRKHKPGAR